MMRSILQNVKLCLTVFLISLKTSLSPMHVCGQNENWLTFHWNTFDESPPSIQFFVWYRTISNFQHKLLLWTILKKTLLFRQNERHWTASKNRHRHRPRRWRRDGDFRRARASQASRSRHFGRHAGQRQHRRRQPSQEHSQNFCNCSRKPPISKMGCRYFTLLRFRTARYSRAIKWYKKTLSGNFFS